MAGIVGLGQTPSADDINDAFANLNDMIAQWATQRWLIYHLIDVYKVATGALSYTVGPGQDFDIAARPNRLETAFVRQFQTSGYPVDTTLRLITAYEDYARIATKRLVSFPIYVFYDSGWPTGTLYFYPCPQAAIYELHAIFKAPFAAFANLATPVNLPPEYIQPLKTNLAVFTRATYGKVDNPRLTAIASKGLSVIRAANLQVPELKMPDAVRGQGQYNIFSDQIT